MELQHRSHSHPLVFHQDIRNQSGDTFHCLGCEGEVLGPCFGCVECGFYLHKKCAEAPVEIDHPFHRDHPLLLLLPSPHDEEKTCGICKVKVKGFVYHCSSCEIYLDINCALLPRDAHGNLVETVHFVHNHPLTLIANGNNHLKNHCCSDCSSTLVDPSYVCFDCKIFFHKKCVELPYEISHPYHRKHKLMLDFDRKIGKCNLCETDIRGFSYRCFLCNVDIHNECDLSPPIIEDSSHHDHQFSLLLRPNISFTCDACGTKGDNVSYICSTCNFQVHKKCILLPRIIRINLHHHIIYHNFFLRFRQLDSKNSKSWLCKICYKNVNVEHGSYYCSKPECDFIIHVNCAWDRNSPFGVKELKTQEEIEECIKELALLNNKSKDCITRVIKEINNGEDVIAAEIEHISHVHNLTFSNEIVDNKHCSGCVQPILSSFYYCSQCDFFLHKVRAEFSRKTLLWLHGSLLTLRTNGIFSCSFCRYVSNGFSYRSDDDWYAFCLRCAELSHSFTHQAHEEHYFIFNFEEKYHKCSACEFGYAKFNCTEEDFALCSRCASLPHTVRHKCDKHFLKLAYRDYNDYMLHQYCDICEERRDPKLWFYLCEDCDTTVHPRCVLGEASFIKPGSNFTDENNPFFLGQSRLVKWVSRYNYRNHPHPHRKLPFVKSGSNFTDEDQRHSLTLVKNIYYYPQCVECGKPCVDLSLECVMPGCNYVVHWGCNYGISSDSSNDSGSE